MRKSKLDKNCKNCDKPFKTNDLQGKFCSIKCARIFNNHIYQKHPPVSFTCENCGVLVVVKDHPERPRRFCSKQCARVTKLGELNPNWKGSDYSYEGLHGWVKARLKKPEKCDVCGENKPLDLANISQEYKQELTDWEWLCRSCHMQKDGRINNLKQNRGKQLKK